MKSESTKSYNGAYSFNGNKFNFKVEQNRTVGRGQADIVLNDLKLSSVHCKINLSGLKIFVTDSNSTNGTFVNNKKIDPEVETEIHVGDKIRIGSDVYIINDENIPNENIQQAKQPSFQIRNLVDFFGISPRRKKVYILGFSYSVYMIFATTFKKTSDFPKEVSFLHFPYLMDSIKLAIYFTLILYFLYLYHSYLIKNYIKKSLFLKIITFIGFNIIFIFSVALFDLHSTREKIDNYLQSRDKLSQMIVRTKSTIDNEKSFEKSYTGILGIISSNDEAALKKDFKEISLMIKNLSKTVTKAVAFDSQNNLYVTGYTANPSLYENNLTGDEDLFVTKYSSNGIQKWTRTYGAVTTVTRAYSIASDSGNNVYITGDTKGGLDGNRLTGYNDLFVMKLNSDGGKLWTKQIGIKNKSMQSSSIVADAEGSIYIGGMTNGSLEGNFLTGKSDLFVVKFNSNGEKIWIRQIGFSKKFIRLPISLSIESKNNLYIAGSAVDDDYDDIVTRGGNSSFLIKINSNGDKLWSRTLRRKTPETNAKILATSADSQANIYIIGNTDNGINDGSQIGKTDLFVSKYDSNGKDIWTHHLGAIGKSTYGSGVSSDKAANIYVTGWTKGALDGNTLTGVSDFFLSKFSTTGSKLWTRQHGIIGRIVKPSALALDVSENLYIPGNTNGGIDGYFQSSNQDFFILRYNSAGEKIEN